MAAQTRLRSDCKRSVRRESNLTVGASQNSEYCHVCICTKIIEDVKMSDWGSLMADTKTDVPAECNCLAVRQAARYITQFYDQHLAAARLRRPTGLGAVADMRRG
jgi:hypothetical protein